MRFAEIEQLVNDDPSVVSSEEVLKAWEDERANVRAVVELAVSALRLPLPRRRLARFLEERVRKILGD